MEACGMKMRIRRLVMKTGLLSVVLPLCIAGNGQAASFDCAKASTKIEKIICDNPEISKLDDELSASYKTALQDEKQADAIREAQKQWIKGRNSCADAACVKRAYEMRLSSLDFTANVTTVPAVIESDVLSTTDVNEPQAYYLLMMSEDDSVCKPILTEYNRDISLDLPKSSPPHPYPWPAPPELAVQWKVKPWNKSIPENERSLLERMYSYIEVDINGDGETETVVRWATWLRGDDRFSSLEIFPHGTVLSEEKEKYRSQADQTNIVMGGGGYDFPKLKGHAIPGTLNDFDLIQFHGKYYVTGKTVEMDGIVETHDNPQWRVISRVRHGEPETPPESELDWVLDSVCYFKLKITK
jgi:uncharacterized protein YecT (DUF1311 family)